MLPTTAKPRRRRRYHSPEFKSRVVAACQAPGVSMAAIAQANQLNANLVRRWVKAAETRSAMVRADEGVFSDPAAMPSLPAFVPVEVVDQGGQEATVDSASAPIRIELRRHALELSIDWPATQAVACARWLRELLR